MEKPKTITKKRMLIGIVLLLAVMGFMFYMESTYPSIADYVVKPINGFYMPDGCTFVYLGYSHETNQFRIMGYYKRAMVSPYNQSYFVYDGLIQTFNYTLNMNATIQTHNALVTSINNTYLLVGIQLDSEDCLHFQYYRQKE